MGQFDPARLNTDPAVRDAFVAAIGETGSLTAAAKATGVAVSTAFRRRKRDAEFGQACEDALARRRGWRLETALIDRAINGMVRVRTYKDGSTTTWVEHDHRLGMWLLAKLLPDRYGLRPAARAAAAPVMSREEFFDRISRPRRPPAAALPPA